MSFVNLKLIEEVPFCGGFENIGDITINTDNIIYVKEYEKHYLVKTKLAWESFHISKEEYNNKLSHLFKKGIIEISLSKMFVKDIEAFWSVEDEYFMQTNWSDLKVYITKEDYDKIIEVVFLHNNNILEMLDSGELFNFNHINIREYLYWTDRNGGKTYIKYFSDEYLVNLTNFLKHTIVKRDKDEKWIKVLNNEIEFRKSL
jgi:hypothetical protein